MMVCVERTGNVTFVKILHENSSINDKNAFRKAVKYLGHFVWEKVLLMRKRNVENIPLKLIIKQDKLKIQ